MPTKFRLPPAARFETISRADHKALYIAEIGSSFELAVGFTLPGGDAEPSTGLLYLTGDSFGQIVIFIGTWPQDIPQVRAFKLDDVWDSVSLHVLTDGSLEPAMGRIGILINRQNIDVYVKDGDDRGLAPLYVDLRELRLHSSHNQFASGLTLTGIEQRVLVD